MSQYKKILFVPVSSISGIGEYARSLIVATELKNDFPELDISFILNKHAACSQTCPFKTYLTEGSATTDNAKVKEYLKQLNPDLVVFDCAGRSNHFKLAKQLGAKVLFISQHEKKRKRGLSLRRVLHIDSHLVVQPAYAIKRLGVLAKLKLNLINKEAPRCIGSVFKLPDMESRVKGLEGIDLKKNNYLVFNAGSGGHKTSEGLASDIFFESARIISQKYQLNCIVIFGNNYPKQLPKVHPDEKLYSLKSLENSQFIGLLLDAKGIVIGGGDTLLQAIELGINSVVSAVSKDQPKRIKRCEFNPTVYHSQLTIKDQVNNIELMLKAPINRLSLPPNNRSKALTTIINTVNSLLALN